MKLLALTMIVLAACDGAFETTHGEVDRAVEALLANDPAAAQAALAEAVQELPESPELHYDRGLAASASGDQAQAIDLLLRALDTRDPVLRQKVNAALGLAHAKAALALEKQAPAPAAPADGAPQAEAAKPDDGVMKEWELAVTFLEDALRDKPDDLESRRTLEVALLRVDPPCSTRDDKYEENDVAGTPKPLELKAAEAEVPQESADPSAAPPQPAPSGNPDELKLQEQLFSCPDDDDWYVLELAAGDRLSVTLTVPPEKGKLALTLEDPKGEAVATGLAINRTIGPGEAGKWLLVVKNVDLDEVSYGLEVKVRPKCDKTEDRFEDNDSGDAAQLLTPGALPDLKLCPLDEDWYAVDLAEGESLFLYAQVTPDPNAKEKPAPKAEPGQPEPPPPPPPFALEIRDANGVRGTGGPSGDAIVATLLTPGAGRYQIRVMPRDPTWEGRYSLMLDVVPPCPEGDDRFEDNDISQDATDFMAASQPEAPEGAQPQQPQQQQGPPVVFARVCPGDVDWWKVADDGTKPAVWVATFEHAQGDLALTLYDESETEIASSDASSPDKNGEGVALPVAPKPEKPKPDPNDPNAPAPDPEPAAAPVAKTYVLKVAGVGEGQNFYLLRLDRPQPQQSDSQQNDDQNEDPQQDPEEKKDPQDEPDESEQPQQEEQSAPLQEALDKLDRNPENLEAKESAKASPRANQRPIKDW